MSKKKKKKENLVLLVTFIQKPSAYLNVFSCINSAFKGTQKMGIKISSVIKKLLRKIDPER